MDGHKGLDPDSVDRVEQLRSQKGNVQERLSESYYRNLSCIKHALIIMGLLTYFMLSLPFRASRWLGGKESTCQYRRCRRHGFSPWVRKIL